MVGGVGGMVSAVGEIQGGLALKKMAIRKMRGRSNPKIAYF